MAAPSSNESAAPRQTSSKRHASSSLVAATTSSEDWSLLTSAADRRRLQNRLAQRTYRKNLQERERQERGRRISSSPSFLGNTSASSSPPEDYDDMGSGSMQNVNVHGRDEHSQHGSPMLKSVPQSERACQPSLTHHHYIPKSSPSKPASWTPSYMTTPQTSDLPKPTAVEAMPFNDTHSIGMSEMQGQDDYFTDSLSDMMFSNGAPHFAGIMDQHSYTHGPMISPRSMIDAGDELDLQGNGSYPKYHSSKPPPLALGISHHSDPGTIDVPLRKAGQKDPASYTSYPSPPSTAEACPSDLRKLGGVTPLHEAAHHGFEAVVSILLENNADLSATTTSGLTALHVAATPGHCNVVRMLLARGANIDEKDADGKTALHMAAEHSHQGLVRLLLENGAVMDAVDHSGRTSLHLASQQGHLSVIQQLLDHHVNIDARDNAGWTALHRAAERGKDIVVRVLIENGADINARTDG